MKNTKNIKKYQMANIEDVLKRYEDYLNLSTNCSFLTIKKYISVIKRFLLTTDLKLDITKINSWLYDKTKLKNCNYYKYAFIHFLICMGRKDLVDQLIMVKKKPRKKVFKFIHKDTMQKIINNLTGLYQKLAFIQLKTGSRVTEVLTMRIENFDFEMDDNMIVIKLGVNKSLTKRGKEKNIYISKRYSNLIKKWFNGKTFGYLFLSRDFENYDTETLHRKLDSIRREYDRKLAESGAWHHVKDLSSHYLRHLFSDYFLKAGGDAIYLKKALNHSKIDTTMDYVSIEDHKVKETLQMMESG
jgi:integrase